MKAIEQYFHVVLFIMLYKVVLTFKSVDETLVMKAIEQYFHVVLFNTLHKVVLTFKSVDETLELNAIEPYFHAILLFMLHKVVLTLRSVDGTSVYNHSNKSGYSVSITSLVAVGPTFQACGRNRSEISPKPNDQYLRPW